jgi:hypothetical protein
VSFFFFFGFGFCFFWGGGTHRFSLKGGLSEFNTQLFTVQELINDQIRLLRQNGLVFLNPVLSSDLQITIPFPLLPLIPAPNFDDFLIPVDEWSLEKLIQPWADERIQELRDAGWALIEAAIFIMFFPALSVLTAFLKPYFAACSPDTAAWLHDPKFHGEADSSDEDLPGSGKDVEMKAGGTK